MSFTIPNQLDAAFSVQAQVDRVDIDILVAALKGIYVIEGCVVTAQGTPDMTVAVADGKVLVDGVLANVSAGNVTIAAADGTNPRFDLIAVDNTGTKSRVAGTAAANPVFPAIPANSIIIASVYVPANDTDIDANQIIDKRVLGQIWTNNLVFSTDITNIGEPSIEITPDEIGLNAGLEDGSAFEAPAVIFGPTWDSGGGAVRKQVELFAAIDDVSGKTEFTINFMQDNLSFSFYGDGTFVNQLGAATIGSSAIPWTQLFLNQYISMVEMTAPAAPAANGVLIYPEDNGAGKTRLMALFSSGAAQQIAIQP